jgi:hypothetical protein
MVSATLFFQYLTVLTYIDLGFRAFSWPLRFAFHSGGRRGLLSGCWLAAPDCFVSAVCGALDVFEGLVTVCPLCWTCAGWSCTDHSAGLLVSIIPRWLRWPIVRAAQQSLSPACHNRMLATKALCASRPCVGIHRCQFVPEFSALYAAASDS